MKLMDKFLKVEDKVFTDEVGVEVDFNKIQISEVEKSHVVLDKLKTYSHVFLTYCKKIKFKSPIRFNKKKIVVKEAPVNATRINSKKMLKFISDSVGQKLTNITIDDSMAGKKEVFLGNEIFFAKVLGKLLSENSLDAYVDEMDWKSTILPDGNVHCLDLTLKNSGMRWSMQFNTSILETLEKVILEEDGRVSCEYVNNVTLGVQKFKILVGFGKNAMNIKTQNKRNEKSLMDFDL